MKRCLAAFVLTVFTLPSLFAEPDLEALQVAVQNRDVNALNLLRPQFDGTVLEMYPQYYVLDWQMREVSEEQVSAFLRRYRDSPLALALRQSWLKELARRKDWNNYRIEYLALSSPTIEQSCYFLQAELAFSRIGSLKEKKNLWFSAKPQPNSCNLVFDRMFSEGILSEEDVWQRIRLVLATANTQFAVKLAESYLTLSIADKIKQIAQSPYDQFISLDFLTRPGQELVIFALDRMARNDPFLAARVLTEYKDQLPPDVVQIAWGRIGFIAAKKLIPEALIWYKNANVTLLPTEARQWMVRFAIRQDDWRTVQMGIEAMPDSDRQLSVWRYWYARALLANKQVKTAEQILSHLVREDNGYYGLLAREELGLALEPMPDTFVPSPHTVAQMKNVKGIQRAMMLYKNPSWRAEAVREWNSAMQNRSDEELLAASVLADQIGWYDRAIYSAEQTRVIHNYRMRFPTPVKYEKDIMLYAAENAIDPAWVYGLIRQESRFAPSVQSHVGAIGIMQIMPATAKWIAARLGEKGFNRDSMTQPLLNIQFGTYYLRYISQLVNGNSIMATAAYNAGPNRPKKWLADRALEGAKWIESIPFDETRDYVKKVMANAMHYAQRINQRSPLLKQRLSIVPGREISP